MGKSGLDRDYLAAVGDVAVSSAALEHVLHEAIIDFHDNDLARKATEGLIKDRTAFSLVSTFETLYSDAPDIAAVANRLRESLTARNRILHGQYMWHWGEGGGMFIQNRKKPGQVLPQPTIEALHKLAKEMSEDAMLIVEINTLRIFGYDRDRFEASLE